MQINYENIKEKSEIIFKATIEGDEWLDAQNKARIDLAKNVTVKGFRKGKAPVAQAAKYISLRDVLDKAADKAVQFAYSEMLKNKNIRPFLQIQPELAVDVFGPEKLSFSFTVVAMPEVTLGDYKNITLEKEAVTVTDEDIENELKTLANNNAELVVVEDDTPAANGDTVVIDFTGYVDGEAFDGGAASEYELSLGSNSFVPGFEDQLVGVKTNEDRDVVITFPENYVADLAGKEATFKVHVNSIKKKNVPAIDDEFAKDLDIENVDTLDQLKEHLTKQINDRKTRQQENEQFNKLVDTIADNSTLFCHAKILKNEADRIVADFSNRLGQQGFDLDDYLKMAGKTKEDFDNEAAVQATKTIKQTVIFDTIADIENLSPTLEDVDARLEEIAKNYNQTLESIKKQLGNQISNFAYNFKQEKVIEFLKNNNNI